MSRSARSPGRRRRLRLVALAGVAPLLFLAALPAVAASGPVLSAGSISPTTGPAGTSFTVRVTYTSTGHGGDGWAPAFVRLSIDGSTLAMQPSDPGDHDYADGAVFLAVIKPAAGSHHVAANAADSHHEPRAAAPLDLGTLVVGVSATPRPTPTSKPTARPTARPTPTPTPRPTPTLQPPAGGAPGATPSALPPASPSPWPSPSASVAATGPPSPTPSPSVSAAVAGPATVADGPGGGGASLSALAGALPPTGSAAWFQLLSRQVAIAIGGSTMVAMALFAFRRRQQDEAPVDPATAEPVPQRLADQLPAAFVAQAPLGALPGEVGMPRWRRPSLRAAREAKPGADAGAIAAQRLTFAEAPSGATGTVERRRLRYRMVRLSDGPDEIRSQELGLLDQGDEVELLEQSGVYWQVRTPLGQVGWIHRMTLGDVIAAAPPATPPAWRTAARGTVAPEAAPEPFDTLEDLEDHGEGLAHRLTRERFTL